MYKFVAIVQVENKNGVKGCVIYKGITEDWIYQSEIEKLINEDFKRRSIVSCNNSMINFKYIKENVRGTKLLYKKTYRGKKIKA